jgi:hypothetical protein
MLFAAFFLPALLLREHALGGVDNPPHRHDRHDMMRPRHA